MDDYVKRLFTGKEDDMESLESYPSSSTPARKRHQPEKYDVRRMSSAQTFFRTPVEGVQRKYGLASAVSFVDVQSVRKQNRQQADFPPLQIVKTKHQMLRQLGIDKATHSDKIIFAKVASG